MKINIQNLKKTFGEKTAVDIAAFSSTSNEIIGIVGNNGAGKTTLFRLMLDLLKADDGTIEYDNDGAIIIPSQTEAWKDFTGAYIDDGFLIDFLTPEEYFQFLARINGISDQQLQDHLSRFEAMMNGEILGQNKLIRTFSAGNKQKIGIIAAMLHKPQLLILDEPFNFLDPTSQNLLKKLLEDYHNETAATILISSHNLQHTIDISTRVILLESGKIIKDLDNHDKKAEQELETYFQI